MFVKLLGLFFILFFTQCTINTRENNLENAITKTVIDTGIIKEVGEFDSIGKKIGKWCGYFVNDQIGYLGYFRNGLKDSVWEFYNKSGTIEKKERFSNGLKNGNTSIYSDGVLYDEMEFKDDKKHGWHKHYYGPNKINFYQRYSEGFFDGDYVLFFENGRIKQKGQFAKGRSVGEWQSFSQTGAIIEKTIYYSFSTKYREIKYSEDGKVTSDMTK